MRAYELKEAIRPAYLYHGTSIANLIQMVHQDRICSGEDTYGPDVASISFTRARTIGQKFATAKSAGVLEVWMNDFAAGLSPEPTEEEMAKVIPLAWAEHYFYSSWKQNGGGAILVLDQEKLRHRYKLEPYCDAGERGANGSKWEMEECITRDVKPMRPYVVGIILCGPFGQIANAVLDGDAKAMLDPHPEYRDAVEFIRARAR